MSSTTSQPSGLLPPFLRPLDPLHIPKETRQFNNGILHHTSIDISAHVLWWPPTDFGAGTGSNDASPDVAVLFLPGMRIDKYLVYTRQFMLLCYPRESRTAWILYNILVDAIRSSQSSQQVTSNTGEISFGSYTQSSCVCDGLRKDTLRGSGSQFDRRIGPSPYPFRASHEVCPDWPQCWNMALYESGVFHK
jgi:hypothetical protein